LNERLHTSRKYEVHQFRNPAPDFGMIRELFVAEGLPLAPDVVRVLTKASTTPARARARNVDRDIRDAFA
jgi:hypothetical protein